MGVCRQTEKEYPMTCSLEARSLTTYLFHLYCTGVTIYHVATGSLPFQPYGGRSNATTM